MSKLTQKAMAQAISDLLQTRTLDKITIKDITDACDLTRNTFYYHFHDVYDLLRWLFEEKSREIMERYEDQDDWEGGLEETLHYLYDNKAMFLHIYESISYDLLFRFINEVMYYNQRVMDELRVVREQLEESKQRLVKQKATLNSKQKELEDQIDAADRLVQDLIATKEGQEKLHAAEQKEFDRVTEELEKFHQQNGDISAGVSDPGTKSVLAGLKWPSKARYITSPFGPRDTGIPGASTDHLGVDIGAAYGTAVYAAQSGKVIQAGWNGGYGYSVTISHGEGVTTLYGHMSSYSVRVGNQVDRGQVIGKCGSTGISSGPHIHYEVRINGKQIDPLPYLPGYIAYDW